mmetsp:Transcript_38215/g.58290  ORF Transcript_38215/g.58290 Transcript_38215/m.58290 type:complete len:377 (+) Transcript_38215:839-1969(+)
MTPYIWGHYSILILPPSFPMGGMENPLLTFASPTIITGDKSQVDVAIHEIAHSWTGNDVTCVNWSNMWLNEGFTVFEERKVTARLHGKDFSKVAAYLGNIDMLTDMDSFVGNRTSNYSSLNPQPLHNLPDDSFSTVPYEKGFQFLNYLESKVGEDDMQIILQRWVLKNSLTSRDYTQFEAHFNATVDDLKNATEAAHIKNMINWHAWVVQPGVPPVIQDFTTEALNQSQALADEYIQLNGTASPANYSAFDKYYSTLKVIFIEELNSNSDNLTIPILQKIDADYNLTNTLDPECKQRWYPLGIRQNFTDVIEPAHKFISSVGRLKYLTPIYQSLIDTDQVALGQQWLEENADFYHPQAYAKIAKMLGVTQQRWSYD